MLRRESNTISSRGVGFRPFPKEVWEAVLRYKLAVGDRVAASYLFAEGEGKL